MKKEKLLQIIDDRLRTIQFVLTNSNSEMPQFLKDAADAEWKELDGIRQSIIDCGDTLTFQKD